MSDTEFVVKRDAKFWKSDDKQRESSKSTRAWIFLQLCRPNSFKNVFLYFNKDL